MCAGWSRWCRMWKNAPSNLLMTASRSQRNMSGLSTKMSAKMNWLMFLRKCVMGRRRTKSMLTVTDPQRPLCLTAMGLHKLLCAGRWLGRRWRVCAALCRSKLLSGEMRRCASRCHRTLASQCRGRAQLRLFLAAQIVRIVLNLRGFEACQLV